MLALKPASLAFKRDEIHAIVKLPDLKAGRGEEGEYQFVIGMPLADQLDQRACLLELAKGGAVKPDPLAMRTGGEGRKPSEKLFSTCYPALCF